MLAALKGFEFGGGYDPALQRSERFSSPLYFVPSETLSGKEAARLGIRGADDLFGGVVPYPFVATKTIAHPLAGRDARRPEGRSEAFPQRVHAVVLPGFAVAQDAAELSAALEALDPGELARCGLVLEPSLVIVRGDYGVLEKFPLPAHRRRERPGSCGARGVPRRSAPARAARGFISRARTRRRGRWSNTR